LAHSSACGGCLQHHHCTPQCASCRRLLYNQEMKFPDYIKKAGNPCAIHRSHQPFGGFNRN
jgi:hypothetical protein